jgi:hypothetical protein
LRCVDQDPLAIPWAIVTLDGLAPRGIRFLRRNHCALQRGGRRRRWGANNFAALIVVTIQLSSFAQELTLVQRVEQLNDNKRSKEMNFAG